MTNRQWLLEQMQNMSDEKLAEAIKVPDEMDRVTNCSLQECEQFEDCNVCVAKWLKSEHKEPIKLSDAERVILENVDKDYKWICRDRNGYLNVYIGKPTKNKEAQVWIWHTDYRGIDVFPNLFQFITWEDEQAYNIQKLLEG